MGIGYAMLNLSTLEKRNTFLIIGLGIGPMAIEPWYQISCSILVCIFPLPTFYFFTSFSLDFPNLHSIIQNSNVQKHFNFVWNYLKLNKKSPKSTGWSIRSLPSTSNSLTLIAPKLKKIHTYKSKNPHIKKFQSFRT